MLRRDRPVMLIVVVSLMCVGLLPGCRRAGEIRIGYLGSDLTDNGTEEMTLLGVDLAIEEINSGGGVFARTLTLARASYNGDRQKAAEEATRLCDEEKVTAIVGNLPTAIVRVVAPVSQAKRVVTISTEAIGKGIEDAGDCVFRVIPGEESAAPLVARFLTGDRGWTKFALVADAGETGAGYVLELYRAALTGYGGQTVVSLTVDASVPDKPLAQLEAKDFDAVVFAGSPGSAVKFIAAARTAGIAQPVYVAGAGADSLLLRAGEQAQGIIVVAGADPDQPSQEQRKFHAAFVAKYSREPDAAAARGYDTVRLIAAAMLAARGTKTDLYAQAIAVTRERPGATGNLTYLAGTRIAIYEPLYILSLDHGQLTLLATLSQKAK